MNRVLITMVMFISLTALTLAGFACFKLGDKTKNPFELTPLVQASKKLSAMEAETLQLADEIEREVKANQINSTPEAPNSPAGTTSNPTESAATSANKSKSTIKKSTVAKLSPDPDLELSNYASRLSNFESRIKKLEDTADEVLKSSAACFSGVETKLKGLKDASVRTGAYKVLAAKQKSFAETVAKMKIALKKMRSQLRQAEEMARATAILADLGQIDSYRAEVREITKNASSVSQEVMAHILQAKRELVAVK